MGLTGLHLRNSWNERLNLLGSPWPHSSNFSALTLPQAAAVSLRRSGYHDPMQDAGPRNWLKELAGFYPVHFETFHASLSPYGHLDLSQK